MKPKAAGSAMILSYVVWLFSLYPIYYLRPSFSLRPSRNSAVRSGFTNQALPPLPRLAFFTQFDKSSALFLLVFTVSVELLDAIIRMTR